MKSGVSHNRFVDSLQCIVQHLIMFFYPMIFSLIFRLIQHQWKEKREKSKIIIKSEDNEIELNETDSRIVGDVLDSNKITLFV